MSFFRESLGLDTRTFAIARNATLRNGHREPPGSSWPIERRHREDEAPGGRCDEGQCLRVAPRLRSVPASQFRARGPGETQFHVGVPLLHANVHELAGGGIDEEGLISSAVDLQRHDRTRGKHSAAGRLPEGPRFGAPFRRRSQEQRDNEPEFDSYY